MFTFNATYHGGVVPVPLPCVSRPFPIMTGTVFIPPGEDELRDYAGSMHPMEVSLVAICNT
jgi:hypothetical protein